MSRIKLINVLVVLSLCVVAVGFYRGWFVLSSHPAGAGGTKVDVNLTIDPGQAKQDLEAVKKKATGLADNAADGAAQGASEDD
jgi:hypothetical protein